MLIESGSGRPILFLHPGIGIDPAAPVLDELAKGGRVIAPSHPGFGTLATAEGHDARSTTSPISISTCSTSSTSATSLVVGVGLGGWIAAEIAVKITARMSRLVMANAVGVKIGDRETRDIVDIWALMPRRNSTRSPISIRRPASATTRTLPEAEVLAAARNREAYGAVRLVALHAQPQAQEPAAPHQASRRCFCGARADRILSETYGRAYCALIAGAHFEPIEQAGHFPASSSSRRSSPAGCSPSPNAAAPPPAQASLRRRAMQVYHFTEQPYYPAWNDHSGSLRVNLPNRKCRSAASPATCSTATTTSGSSPTSSARHHGQRASSDRDLHVVDRDRRAVGAGARDQERAASWCSAIRSATGPIRCAAPRSSSTIDVISRGRLDMGFIKGVPYEFPASNQNPVGVMDRFWEAHDFIIKAMTSHDEPFNWEGEYFHYRQVNVWPRPVQQPHPPVWTTTGSKRPGAAARREGLRDGDARLRLRHAAALRRLSRAAIWRSGSKPRRPDRFAYLGLVAVADDEAEARRRGELVAGYLRSSAIVHVPFRNPPGFLSVEDNARMLRGQSAAAQLHQGRPRHQHAHGSVQDLIDAGILFCGTPDQVYEQIVDFTEYCGGMGNLLMMGHAGFLTHEDTVEQSRAVRQARSCRGSRPTSSPTPMRWRRLRRPNR